MTKLLFDLFPILLFFIAYKYADIYTATGVAIAATFVQIGWLKLRGRRVETMQWLGLGVIVVFGGLTLLLHDETFIKWKPTILYWLFGTGLVIARLTGRNLMKTLMGSQLVLPEPVWDRLNQLWIGYFAVMGALNLWVAYSFETDTWVNFKLFGTLGLTLVFVLLQGLYLGRHIKEPDAEQSPADGPVNR
ncbi:MAG: septation protein A [Lautropia sp.]